MRSPSATVSSPGGASTGPGANPNEISIRGDGAFDIALDEDGAEVGFTVFRGHPYCEACHVRLRAPKCRGCKRSIRDGMRAVEALGGKWCFECFVCAVSCISFLANSRRAPTDGDVLRRRAVRNPSRNLRFSNVTRSHSASHALALSYVTRFKVIIPCTWRTGSIMDKINWS